MAQLNYSYDVPAGIAGTLSDAAPHDIMSRLNGETEAGKLKLGMGAVQGDNPGQNVKIPDSTATADKFEGVIMTQGTNQQKIEGGVKIYPKDTVGVLNYGHAWGRVDPDISAINYGDRVYLINTGDKAGLFTNEASGNIALKGRFLSDIHGDIANIELYNAPNF